MKIIREGHKYSLENFEGRVKEQEIQFIEKIKTDNNELETVFDGTTNEEVLKVLLNRMNYLNSKFPCRENSLAITKLQEALMWLEERTKDREDRGVEGKHIK